MTQFRVLWDEDIEAEIHMEDAHKARALMAGPISRTHIFVVEGEMGDNRCVDLRDDTTSPPLVTPHKHRFSGDDDTCNVYRECTVTWPEFRAHRTREQNKP